MTFETWFKEQHPKIPTQSAAAVLKLAAEGSTVPFIARYRKEQTGNLDEVGIQSALDAKERWDDIVKKKAHILDEIDKQKKLTPELKEKIEATFDLQLLEDIYLPYRQKRKSKAAKAREAGLEPLADWIWNTGHGTEQPQPGQTLELWALTFRVAPTDKHDGVKDAAEAIAGAQDILIERISEKQELRQLVRSAMFERGFMRTEKGEKAEKNSKFDRYFEYQESVKELLEPQNSHRYLAIRRGWMEGELKLSLGGELPADDQTEKDGKKKKASSKAAVDPLEEELLRAFEADACTVPEAPGAAVLAKAAKLALRAHVMMSIDSEVHKALKDVADLAAIKVFADNVRKLLLASPFGPKAVLGIDPGLRTGCKVAAVDDSGKFIAHTVMRLQSESEQKNAKVLLGEVLKNAAIRAIAVGNGTAGRETESFVRSAVKELGLTVPVVMVSESGASVYSASEAAREEFPELDVTVRGAISIARRLQDPLAELVKIDPKSIGVGQYQHDVSPHALKKSLDQAVESCVNAVGVNLNTASYHLLAHVSGIGPGLAKAIVEHRNTKGLFKSRQALLDVPRFSQKAFEQSAGFLRIPDSENPLDNTGVHPERYPALEGLAQKIGKHVRDFIGSGVELVRKARELKDEIGALTFEDVVRELEKPGRDPREEFVAFQFRDDIHEVKDLEPG
ncbi:MAG: helix-hairpin-helix domain-containing protein, partial [Deltaproteobacteria bacterium]|nr:helix-hairpin-helix domain-containing protein [Deltaproteobacteria bacterium]